MTQTQKGLNTLDKHITHTNNYKDDNISYDSDSTCSDNNTQIDNKLKLKVELCRNFLDNKVCPYKYKCKFAHGLEELLKNTDLCQNFRTKKCKIFYEKGHCKFGQRCNFKHSETDKQTKKTTGFLHIFEQFPEMIILKKNKKHLFDIQQTNEDKWNGTN